MTHEDIYTKFMIEYDKAQITSSYPSLTPYEIAVILDKAYLAYIAQKVTGNNPRQAPFEADTKAIEDVRPLLTTATTTLYEMSGIENGVYCKIPEELLYYIQSVVRYTDSSVRTTDLVSHENAKKFMRTTSNLPWIKGVIAYIEEDKIIFLYDSFDKTVTPREANNTYIRKPSLFALRNGETDFKAGTKFELSETQAEEVISLAVLMAAENVESPRMTSKAQTRSLEA